MTYANRGGLTAVGIIFSILALGALALRAYGLQRRFRKVEIDDIFVIVAAPLTIGTGVAIAAGAQLRIIGGASISTLNDPEEQRSGEFEYAFWIPHVLAIGCIKLAILFMFRRIFMGRAYRTVFDYTNWTLIILVVLWTVVFFFLQIFVCGLDPAAAWRSLESLRHQCLDSFSMMTGSAVFSWVMDLSILAEPLFMIGRLQMSFRRKLQASLVFVFSILAVVAGLLRMIILIQVKIQDVTSSTTWILATEFPTTDEEGIVSLILFWTYVEIGVGFLVACLPPCARLLDVVLVNPITSTIRSILSDSSASKSNHTPRSEVDGDRIRVQKSWKLTTQLKTPRNQHSEDDIQLVTALSEAFFVGAGS